MAPDTRLALAIGLPPADARGLDDFLQNLYDPGNPLYRQYLTPAQFVQRFGPSQEQYEQVVAFALTNNLTVTQRHSNRLVLDVTGSVADIERAFQVTLHTYRHPTQDRDFYAPDTDPSVAAQLPVLDVSGLNNYILPHPKSIQLTGAPLAALPRSGSAPSGAFWGNDFRAAYLPGVKLTGAGQMLGLVQFDGFYSSDITAYETAAGLPNVPLQAVLLDGFDGTPITGTKSGNPEVSLDIEMAISMAPGLAKIVCFEAGPNGLQNDILSAMASHSEIKEFSCSWGWGGGPNGTTDNLFKQMAAQGQSFFSASGDSDAFPAGAVDDPNQPNAPSSCPYITVVGGTTLQTSGPQGSWLSETVWNRGGGVGSSGGISSYYNLPVWQEGLNLSAAAGSPSQRNTPDVAMVAENIYVNYGNGSSGTFGGTSCASPLWAGLAALLNQQSLQAGNAPVGFINPALYALAKGSTYPQAFHDTTRGDNTSSSSPNLFYAVAGYDLCTGWGTPAGPALINALAGPLDSLLISPTVGFVGAGALGGPFAPSSGQFVLTNSGATSVTCSQVSTSNWLMLDRTSATLAPGSAIDLKASLAPGAAQLAEGLYQANVTVSNWASHVTQAVSCKLQVGQSILQNGGFETGDFSDWTLVGKTVVNSSNNGPTIYNAVESNASGYQVAHSGNYGAFLGDTQLASLSQTVPTVDGQAYLLSFWLNNPTSGTGQQFLVSWTGTAGAANPIYSLENPPALGWTNLQLIVTAEGAQSQLQFEAENVPGGFGLDDVNLRPLPPLSFETVGYGAGGCQLSWRAASGVLYQLQYSTDLAPGSWTNLGTPVTGNGALATRTDPGAAPGGQRFYRLVVSP